MRFHHRLSEFTADYDALIIDLWGVIHDGSALYPHAKEALEQLHKAGKKVLFLSNAPRRSHKVITMLTSLGIERHLYLDVLSSGEVFFQYAMTHSLGDSYLYIGSERDADLLDGFPSAVTEDPAQASFAVVTGFDHDESVLEEKLPQLEAVYAANLPLYCINPDMVVVRQTGERSLCAGVIAEQYYYMGGDVIYFGKPHPAVYEASLERLGQPDFRRIAAIGDSLDTDIKGASVMGIDSVLVTGGILKARVGDNPEKLTSLCREVNIVPKRVIPAFMW